MGSVFRQLVTRPVPAGAETFTRQRRKVVRKGNGERVVELVDETCARWKDRAGKTRTAVLVTRPDGTRRIRQESGTYHAKYRDHDGNIQVVPTGCRSESAAEQVLNELEKQAERVKSGVVTAQELAVADRKKDPIEEHIADYIKTLTGSAEHRGHTERYIRRLAKDCRWTCLADMRRDQLELWLADQSRPGPDGLPIRSARSRNAYHTAIVSFCNWCAHPDNGRLTRNPFLKIKKADVDRDRREIRRSLAADEVEQIIEAARNAPRRPPTKSKQGERPEERLTGPGRAFLWAFLAGTGLRLNEARELTIELLRLDGDRPGIDLPPWLTKAKTKQYVPLYDDLAERLRRDTAGRSPLERVFTIPEDILRRFKGDCKRAGIPLLDDRGRKVDIHALRMSFIMRLVKAGIHPKTVQELARHSSIEITMKYYTDLRVTDLHAALGQIFVARTVTPAVTPTGVNSGVTESSPDNSPPSEDSPQVLGLPSKRRVS